MPLTDDQTEVLARDLLTIARCARTLHAQLQPGSNAGDGVWHRPVYKLGDIHTHITKETTE